MTLVTPHSGVDFGDGVSSQRVMETPDTGIGSDSAIGAFSHLDDGKEISTNHMLESEHGQQRDGALQSDDDELSLADVAQWAKDLQKHNIAQSNSSKGQSYNIASDYITNRVDIAGRRASTTTLTRRTSNLSLEKEESPGSRPASGMLNSRMRTHSYANNDGVQLRGDKGNARRKSTTQLSRSTSYSTIAPVSNEWKRSFNVAYAPREKATKIVRGSIAPPRIRLNLSQEKESKEKSATESMLHHHKNQSHSHIVRHSSRGSSSFPHSTPKSRHVEIHYENCLPKDLWLEMKPKRFTRNHKHGNHFEFRKLDNKHTKKECETDEPKKEAFVWENPYQIWLMQKTHPSS